MIEARFEHRFAQGAAPGNAAPGTPGFSLDVDLRLPARGVSVLFGPSGCGKTTLLRCLAGLQRAGRGRLVVDGEVWQDDHRFVPVHRRAIGMVFQETSLFPHLTVQGNLDYGLRRAGAAAGAAGRTALEQAIALMGIAPLLPRRPEALSGGERQRVAIARALALGPRLLLMDEPLAALDARRKQEIVPFLDRLHRELTTPVVYVTHAIGEVMRLADHVVALDAGRATAAGPLFEMVARLDVPQLAQDEAAGVVLPCTVVERDGAFHLSRMAFDGGALWTRDLGHAVGDAVRVQVLARDVSLALHEPQATSIANQWPGRLQALADDVHPANRLALVRVGGVLVMSRLTHRSATRLALQPGMPVWVQVKAVAVVG
ncbi:MAG: molybdenum ABC transporter ATP-binding protein [Rubrivivax sp.]|nr:molybdenum ABC transporter ATP-binding protein [Rubrivivax sp.]